jgi:hypothetical protein
LGKDLGLASDEMLQVSANGTDWVVATGSNKVWVTADDAVTLVTGIGNLTARMIDTAGNVTALPLSNNCYTLDTSAPTLLIATVCVPAGIFVIVVSMVTSEVSPEPFTVFPNKVPYNLTCMTYLATTVVLGHSMMPV